MNKRKILIIGANERMRRKAATLINRLQGAIAVERESCTDVSACFANRRIDVVLLENDAQVEEETLRIRSDASARTLGPGEWAVLCPDQVHELFCADKSCTFLCVQVSPHVLERFFPACARTRWDYPFPGGCLPDDVFAELKERVRTLARAYLERRPYYELCCAGQVCLVWHALLSQMPTHTVSAEEASQEAKRSARAQRLLRFVEENYKRRIRLSVFARAEGCSVNHMSFFVHRTLNQSFQQYVNAVRFHCACKLMDAGRTRMTDVCIESGFSDYRYFAKAFRDRLGVTPEEYCRRAQPLVQDQTQLHHSIHSLERFYTREKSLELLKLL